MATETAFYPYRTKLDGSRDSICLVCFRTVRGETAEDLAENECNHLCDAMDILPHDPELFPTTLKPKQHPSI